MRNPPEIEAVPLSRRTIMLITASALAAAIVILLVAVLPAEFDRDPTGLGKATGIAALWAPEETIVAATQAGQTAQRSYSTPFRSDVLDIDLGDSDRQDGREAVEYKVRMAKGSTFLYAWEVADIADPDEFYTEFHGHTVVAGKSMTVANYRKATGASDNGVLTALFDGVHGWYFQNQSAGPVKIRLRISGYYTLIPDGLPGNEAGLHASPTR